MREAIPSRDEARALARDHALIPVYREVLADMLTPVRAYTLLCPPGTPGFLLESVEGGERLARYSFIGSAPKPLELDAGDPLAAVAAGGGGRIDCAGERRAAIPRRSGRLSGLRDRAPFRAPAGRAGGAAADAGE